MASKKGQKVGKSFSSGVNRNALTRQNGSGEYEWGKHTYMYWIENRDMVSWTRENRT